MKKKPVSAEQSNNNVYWPDGTRASSTFFELVNLSPTKRERKSEAEEEKNHIEEAREKSAHNQIVALTQHHDYTTPRIWNTCFLYFYPSRYLSVSLSVCVYIFIKRFL